MGCVTVHIGKKSSSPKVNLHKNNMASVAVEKLLCHISCCIKSFKRLYVSISYNNKTTVAVSHTYNISVGVGLVCTVSYGENEMWWCDNWRVLWNNGIKALWPGE